MPPENIKQRNPDDPPLRIPMSDAAMGVLEQARATYGGRGYIFPGRSGQPMDRGTTSHLLRYHRIGIHLHGFRASFGTWCGENDVRLEHKESALGHILPVPHRETYDRGDYFSQRVALMERWSRVVLGD